MAYSVVLNAAGTATEFEGTGSDIIYVTRGSTAWGTATVTLEVHITGTTWAEDGETQWTENGFIRADLVKGDRYRLSASTGDTGFTGYVRPWNGVSV